MKTKQKYFYAYQIDLHYLKKGKYQTDATKWDPNVVRDLLYYINGLLPQSKTQRHQDSWLVYLDHYSEEPSYFFGRLAYAEYGTVGQLVHADNLTTRPNPKLLREGETLYTNFIIRKSDGLMLLQSSVKLDRPRVEQYFEQFGRPVILANQLEYIQICTLLDSSFFDDIRSLNTVNRIWIEVVTANPAADENKAVKELQNQAETIESSKVKLEFSAQYKRSGMSKVIPFLRNYKDMPGVSKIAVKGKLAGAEKVIRMSESQEKYKKKVEVDGSGQPTLRSVEANLSEILRTRSPLIRRDSEDEQI